LSSDEDIATTIDRGVITIMTLRCAAGLLLVFIPFEFNQKQRQAFRAILSYCVLSRW
jgi:hypothetical protein